MPPEFTIGVEEEFHIVDLETRYLVPEAKAVLDATLARGLLGPDQVKPELHDSTVEINGGICRSLDDLRGDMVRLRREVVAAAKGLGLAVVPVGTVPLVKPDTVGTWPEDRFLRMHDDYQLLVREQLICGQHTHVHVGDPEIGYAALPRISPWLPALLALSASSPFWMGADTGYASWRSLVWRRWPTSGSAPLAASAYEHREVMDAVVRTGVVADKGMFYFDARYVERFGTVEFRIADSCPRLDDSVLLAGLARALAWMACSEVATGRALPTLPKEVIEVSRWQACRYGLTGKLVDPLSGTPRPAEQVIHALLEYIRPALDATGEAEQVTELVRQVMSSTGSAQRQRAAWQRRNELTDVVDALISESESATSAAC